VSISLKIINIKLYFFYGDAIPQLFHIIILILS